MIGAIIGDIVGSRFEFHNYRKKDFDFLSEHCFATDDSLMTIAVARAILDCHGNYDDLSANVIISMQDIGNQFPDAGYGNLFRFWLIEENPKPYYSYGNGAAMRISPVGFIARTEEEVKDLSYKVTAVSHNHPEGLKGAESVAMAIFLLRKGYSIEQLKDYINKKYYKIDFTLKEIQNSYRFDESCQGTVPQAFEAFFESTSFEDAIRNAISIGGDSDTLAAIVGGMAEAYWGITNIYKELMITMFPENLAETITKFVEYAGL